MYGIEKKILVNVASFREKKLGKLRENGRQVYIVKQQIGIYGSIFTNLAHLQPDQ